MRTGFPVDASYPFSEPELASLERLFVRTRKALILGQGCGTRLNQLISPLWDDRGPIRHSLPGAFLLSDIFVYRKLGEDDRLRLGIRLAIDAAEIAVSVLTAVRDDYDESAIPLFPGCALAVEAGARLGWKGLAVPLVNGAAAAGARKLRKWPDRSGLMGWQVAGCLGGMALASYGRRRRTGELELHRRQRAARIQRAEMEGRADIAATSDAVLDAVQRATVLVHLATGDSTSNVAGQWKEELAQQIRQEYAFLGDVISSHQARANAVPDLRSVVRFLVNDAAGSLLLSREQATMLQTELARLAPTGKVIVTARSDRDGTDIFVDEHLIRLQVPVRDLKLTFDPIPGGFAWMAVWLAVASGKTRERVPGWASFGPAVLALTAMVMAHNEGSRSEDGKCSRERAVVASSVLALASTVVQTRTMRNKFGAGGTSRFPFTLSQRGLGLVSMLAWRELSKTGRSVAVGSALANIALGWALSAKPRSRREGFADLIWPIQAVMLAGTLAKEIDDDAAIAATQIRKHDEETFELARNNGRLQAQAFAQRCLDEAVKTLETNRTKLGQELRTECESRLALCSQRLRDFAA